MTKEKLDGGKEKLETPGPVPVGKPDKVATLEDLAKLYKEGETSTLASSLNRNIDSYAKGSLPKEYAFIMADIHNKEAKSHGGYPKGALHNFDKFQDLSAQEMCMELIESNGNVFPILDLENDKKKIAKDLEENEALMTRKKSDGFKEEDLVELQSKISKLSNENGKIQNVLSSINKRTILETMSKTKNLLIPERMQFFLEGEQKLDINYTDIVSNFLDSQYSASYIRSFIEHAPDASVDKNIIKRLNAIGGVAENLDTVYSNKFKG